MTNGLDCGYLPDPEELLKDFGPFRVIINMEESEKNIGTSVKLQQQLHLPDLFKSVKMKGDKKAF